MRHYKIGDGPNGKLFVSTHQIPDLSIANTSIFSWENGESSFTSVVLISHTPLNVLKDLIHSLLTRCERFSDVESIAVLADVQWFASRDVDYDLEAEAIKWCFEVLIDVLNTGEYQWALRKLTFRRFDSPVRFPSQISMLSLPSLDLGVYFVSIAAAVTVVEFIGNVTLPFASEMLVFHPKTVYKEIISDTQPPISVTSSHSPKFLSNTICSRRTWFKEHVQIL